MTRGGIESPDDPFGTVHRALWIGGGQWAGKTTVAGLLAHRHGLTAYHYDAHDARGHQDRRVADRVRRGEPPGDPAPDEVWVDTSAAAMAAATLGGFGRRFGWALDDLRALRSPRPVLAEGWGLRPELVVGRTGCARRMVVLVATEEFRRHQERTLPRAGRLDAAVRDPERAQRNRVERDRLVAADAVRAARRLGVAVVEVDGSRDAEQVADLVADVFAPFLAE